MTTNQDKMGTTISKLNSVTLATLIALAPATAIAGKNELVSNAYTGAAANGNSIFPSISANGRYVAFASTANNLVPGDTNNRQDMFVYDRETGQMQRVSVASDGAQANSDTSFHVSISADGRYVAFESAASNLVAGDTNGQLDAFVHDRLTGVTERVSIASNGAQGNQVSSSPNISADGRYVTFYTSASLAGNPFGITAVMVRDRLLGTTEWVSAPLSGNGYANAPSISADGRYVAFVALGEYLPGSTTKGYQIYVKDRQTNSYYVASVSGSGAYSNKSPNWPKISADGRFVTFMSQATNLTSHPVSSVLTNIYIRDLQLNTTEIVSASLDGTNPTSASHIVGGANVISADGRYVVFYSGANNLVSGDTSTNNWDVFVRDRQNGTTERVSLTETDEQANDRSDGAGVSADGRYVVFHSRASNLVANDANGAVIDVFVRDRVNNQPPFAFAGYDQLVEATAVQTPVTLDGSGSSDPDGDELSFTWTGAFGIDTGMSPVINLGLGSYAIQMSVDDGKGGIASDDVNIIVQDTTSPTLNVPADVAVTATGPSTTVNLGDATATDIFLPVNVTNDAPEGFPVGTTVVTWTATDANGNVSNATQNVSATYEFGGFLSPLKAGGTYKIGRTLPVKFQLFYADGSLVTDATATITVQQLSSGQVVGDPIVVEATNNPDGGNTFTFTDDHYQYNLNTGFASKGAYRIMVDVGDGSPLKMIDIAFK